MRKSLLWHSLNNALNHLHEKLSAQRGRSLRRATPVLVNSKLEEVDSWIPSFLNKEDEKFLIEEFSYFPIFSFTSFPSNEL